VRDVVSKAGSEPAATGSKVETESATAAAAGKKQILSQEYRASIPAPQLRKEVIGLYGYEILKTAKGFRIFAQDAIDKSETIINRIREMPPSMDVIRAMDDISDTVCTVVDAAELCRNTHPDK
jgi:hypothetical protein